MLKNGEDACDGAYSVNFLNDSKLLNLGFSFNHYLSHGTCALIKQYAKHLYNSILMFQFKSNHAILLNKTFKSFWMINVNTIHILISYTIIYGSLIIPNIHFHMQKIIYNQIMHFIMLFSFQFAIMLFNTNISTISKSIQFCP